jgi:hypothetical protein
MAKMGLRPLHVFGAAFVRSLFVGNTIVGNAIWVRLNEMHVTNLSFTSSVDTFLNQTVKKVFFYDLWWKCR